MEHLWLLSILILIWGFLACDSEQDKCFSADINAGENELEEVSKTTRHNLQLARIFVWLDQQKVTKPEKCEKRNPSSCLNADLHDSLPIFESRLCGMDEEFRPHSFRGSLPPENGLYQGAGKFKIGTFQDGTNAAGNICFVRQSIFGSLPANITGTFIDGRPHGAVKIDLENGMTVVGRATKGHLEGKVRLWREGALELIGLTDGSGLSGLCWRRRGTNWYFFRECASFGRWRERADEALFIINKNEIFGGEKRSYLSEIQDVTPILDLELSEDEECLLIPRWRNGLGEKDWFHTFGTDKIDSKASLIERTACVGGDDDLEGRIKSWIHENTNPESPPHHFPEKPAPNAPKLIGNLTRLGGNRVSLTLMGIQESRTATVTNGFWDEDDQLQGEFAIDLDANATFEDWVLKPAKWVSIEGVMRDSEMDHESAAVIFLDDGRYYLTTLSPEGVLHGRAVLQGWRPLFPVAEEYDTKDSEVRPQRGGVFNFKNGRPFGVAWLRSLHDSLLYGPLDKDSGTITSEDAAYIYPDFRTVLAGSFRNRVMEAARPGRIQSTYCDELGMMRLRFEVERDPSGRDWYYSPPTNESFGHGPREQDPYEAYSVEMAPSLIPDSGDGVFAKRKIKANALVLPFSGFAYRNLEELEIHQNRFGMNESLSRERRRKSVSYGVRVEHTNSALDFPLFLLENEDRTWFPTLGHKVNCALKGHGANSVFSDFEHPRYGLISGVFASRDLEQGEEVLVDYEYQVQAFPYDFPWYTKLVSMSRTGK